MKKQLLALTICLISFFACQKEDITNQDSTVGKVISNRDVKITRVDRAYIENDKRLSQKIDDLMASNSLNRDIGTRTVYNEQYNFIVDTGSAVLIEDGDYHSYTFAIIGGDLTVNENLLLSYNSNDDSYNAYRTTYNLTHEERVNAIDGNYEYRISENLINTELLQTNLNISDISRTGGLVNLGNGLCGYFDHVSIDPDDDDRMILHFVNVQSCNSNNNPSIFDVPDSAGGGYGTIVINFNYSTNGPTEEWDADDWEAAGGGTFSVGNGEITYFPTINTVPVVTKPGEVIRILDLTFLGDPDNVEKARWVSDSDNTTEVNAIYYYLKEHTNKFGTEQEALDFADELIGLAQLDIDYNSDVFNFVLEAKIQNKLYNAFDDNFYQSINQYTDIDLTIDGNPDPWAVRFAINCIVLRDQHPDWSNLKIFWEASKEGVHLTLDVLGLIPVFGEPADIINGIIYTFEGDNLNAGLSFAGAIPFVGWLSTGTKMTIKVVNQTTQGLIGLVWKTGANGVITFGSRNTLKHVIGTAGTGNHAHHIIPWAKSHNDIVQKAANSSGGFNMNEALNGIGLSPTLHQTGHNLYSAKIDEIFGVLDELYPDMTSNQAYNHIVAITNQIRNIIINNPTLNSGELANLIVYP